MAVLTSRGLKDGLVGLNETRKAIENAENRARFDQKTIDSKVVSKSSREYAQALHREADQLYRSGDYETALVLYHRAANLFPRDSSHSVAARRTAATISSCNNPSKAVRKALPSTGTGERLTAALCPEMAAVMANEKLKKSPEPSSIGEVLSYFDSHKSYWKTGPYLRLSNTQLKRSKVMLKQLNNLAETSLKSLQAAFDSGKMSTALKIAQELLVLSGGFQDPSRYQIAAYHFLSLIHVALGRHDRAVCSVSRMVRLSKSTGDVVQICRSFVTLGKVHLSFGHLDAAAKAWEHLSRSLKKPIPTAWIRHEIGRCYLETGKYERAVEMGFMCVDAAVKGNTKKWMLNGRLLLGQSLAKLGRFTESLDELQIAAKITEEEGDTPMLSYIRDLIDQMVCALRGIPFKGSGWQVEQTEEDLMKVLVSREETVISTVFSQKNVIAEQREEGSSSEDEASVDRDEEITRYSEKTVSLVPTYRESTARTDVQEAETMREEENAQEEDEEDENAAAAGGFTFRVEKLDDKMADARSSSSSSISLSSSISASTSSNTEEKKSKSKSVAEDAELSTHRTGNSGQDEEDESKRTSSKVSLRSSDTTATYVIENQPVAENALQLIQNLEGDRGVMAAGREASKVAGYSDAEQRGDMLNALRVIEELGNKNEVELLEMLKDMLLSTGGSVDFGNAGDGFRTSRSGEDRQNGVATDRSTRTISLPASPRKCNADGDFRDRGKALDF